MVRDLLFREINVGDVVSYPRRSGASMWVMVGKVEALEEPCAAFPGGRVKVKALTQDGFGLDFSSRWVDSLSRVALLHGEKPLYAVNADGERIPFDAEVAEAQSVSQ